MSDTPNPASFATMQAYIVAESMEDAKITLEEGSPLWDREEAEGMLKSYEFSTGERHYIFALDIRIQQATS